MDDAEFYNHFYIALAIAGAIVLIAAVLLILILIAALRINKLATAALEIVSKIKQNTLSIWELQKTNHSAIDISADAENILQNAAAVATALHETEKSS